MTANRFLIDDNGLVWPAEPVTIADRFGVARRRRNLVVQAVGLGFTFVAFSAAGARVAIRPAFITRRAIARLAILLAGPRPERVALSCDGRLASWELIIGVGPAIARIDALVYQSRRPEPRPLQHEARLRLACCADIGQGRLLPLLQGWEEEQGRWRWHTFDRLQEAGLLSSTIVARKPHSSEQLLIEHWGSKFLYGPDWRRIARGRDVEDQPNADVGRWRAVRMRQTIDEGVPWLTSTQIVTRAADRKLLRLQFLRLTLPWRDSDGTTFLTATKILQHRFVLEKARPAS
jgi:hypothetical protein